MFQMPEILGGFLTILSRPWEAKKLLLRLKTKCLEAVPDEGIQICIMILGRVTFTHEARRRI